MERDTKDKIVIDTNVIVSGIHWRGDSHGILQLWLAGDIEVITSIEIIDEMLRILKNFKIPLQTADIERWENLFYCRTTLVEPKTRITIIKEDPADNKFIEAAIEGGASHIISQDKHLLSLHSHAGIKTIHPRDFLLR